MKSYERLDVWRVAHELALAVYAATDGFPVRERYGICSQVRRAAVSVAANIAEGSAKRGHREFRRYLDIALGSLAELSYLLRLSKDLGLLTSEAADALKPLLARCGLMTWKLYRSLAPTSAAG